MATELHVSPEPDAPPPTDDPTSRRRALRAVGLVFAAYLVLVATHLGEFWPASIYPMFSQAGQPWQRAVVRDVTDEPLEWRSVAVGDLPGRAYPLKAAGVDAIDLANFVSKTTAWNERRVGGLRSMLQADRLGDRTLMVYRVRGYLDPASDSVRVSFDPYLLVTAEGYRLHPELPTGP